MYGRAFGWEWFVETVPDCELFPRIDYSDEVYRFHWLRLNAVLNRRTNGKPVYRPGDSE